MNIESIKKLIKEGDIPQARNQLREVLSKSPEDTVAQMLYGTCCQLMGDSVTFSRIYRNLAPEMELRVAHGERSERVSMWLKYAAMFAVVLSLVCSASGANEGISSVAIGHPTNETSAVTTEKDSNLYDSVLNMPLRDQLRYFLKRPEVSRELHKRKLRAVVIPLQGRDRMFEGKVDYLLLIRVASSLKTGSDVVKALKKADKIHIKMETGKKIDSRVFVQFSSFEQCFRKGEMIPSKCDLDNVYQYGAMQKVIETMEKHGEITDLIASTEAPDSNVLGICFVNIHGTCALNRTKYAGPRDYGDRFPKYIKAPDGTVLYELTEEEVRKQFEAARKAFENHDNDF